MNRSRLREALAEAERHYLTEDMRVLVDEARRWSEFPTVKDVEVAINAFRSTKRSDNDGWDGLLNPIRAALSAVRARETGETET